MVRSLILLQLLCLVLLSRAQQTWKQRQKLHLDNPPLRVGPNAIPRKYLVEDMVHFNRTLANILIPRVPGTRGSQIVREFIADEMRRLGWVVEFDRFEQDTVIGKKVFSNVIATLDPNAPRRLILACHYDSKKDPAGFLGATDSAVPCAQMINLAKVMQEDLKAHTDRKKAVTLQLVFFDGEEAFVTWNDQDSIYGSRHLARKWKNSPFEVVEGVRTRVLGRIDALVLLDLLGSKNPTITSSDPNTHKWFLRLSQIEDFLGLGGQKIFQRTNQARNLGIADDHLEFQKNGVPILHLIAAPFPSVWHTIRDDLSAVDFPTVVKLNKIFRLFVRDYLQLP